MSLQTVTVPISELKPHPDNPRASDTDRIAESLRANGQYLPLVLANDGTILVGNHRYAAMMEMGWENVEVIYTEYGPRDDAAIKIMLADNRTTDDARYDTAALVALLNSLDESAGLFGTGYDSDDFDDLLARIQEDVSTPLRFNTDDPAPTGISTEPTLGERQSTYEKMGRRLIVLDYDQEIYREVTEGLAALRNRYAVESNAELLRLMIGDLMR